VTADGDSNSQAYWDAAREALGAAADFFLQNTPVDPEMLPDLLRGAVRDAGSNYDSIPQDVRQTLEQLSRDEQVAIRKMFQNLALNHFYLEGGPGGLRRY
jgi:hypothetical protein